MSGQKERIVDFNITHSALCRLAVDWLMRPASRKGPGCLTAVSETANAINGEIPDAIGWRPYSHNGCGSTLVEVKISRSDFLADTKKPHRNQPQIGMGTYRYYMAPVGLIAIEELPPRWGLVEVTDRGHLKIRAGHVLAPNIRPKNENDPWRHEASNVAAELSLLAMALNRVGDPQKLQDMLRESSNKLARSNLTNEKLKKRIEDLQYELRRLRHGIEPGTPSCTT